VLWGDFTLVDPAENFAQGYEAYALGLAASLSAYSQFGNWAADPSVARESLNGIFTCSRMRFLLGGPFDARTSLFVYTPPPTSPGANECLGDVVYHVWDLRAYDEEGQEGSSETRTSAYRTSGKIEVGPDFQTHKAAGYVELETLVQIQAGINPVPSRFPNQHLLLGAIQASGRFAVGTQGGPCGN
jgi:hypothetical protein